jgi:hypothetical protein
VNAALRYNRWFRRWIVEIFAIDAMIAGSAAARGMTIVAMFGAATLTMLAPHLRAVDP